MIDVTDRRQMEEWLRDSEALYRNLVEEVPDIIFSLDAEGRFTFANTQIENFLGYRVDQILDTPLEDHVVPEERKLAGTIFRMQPHDIWDEEVGILDREGQRKFARIRCKASFDDSQRPIGFEGVMRDRTERRKLEEDLRASKEALVQKIMIIDELYEHIVQSGKCKAIQDHTAEVAHELRQPLVIVGGFARRIARELDSKDTAVIERRKRYVDLIVTEIERLERILEKLIDFTRRGEVQLQWIDPNGLIEYILGVTDGRLKEKKLLVKKNLGSELGEIPVDPGRFQQLMLNLISNAIDASPEGGVIELETGATIPIDRALRTGELQSEVFFELKIRNNGPTIPPEVLEQIFNPFFTTKRHGTGLGLTVSRKIVEDHAGSISVKSDEHGTSFTIWLPMN
jgi:PAS domain S-box-containing protein